MHSYDLDLQMTLTFNIVKDCHVYIYVQRGDKNIEINLRVVCSGNVHPLEDMSLWLIYMHLTSLKVLKVSGKVAGISIPFQVIVLSLILDRCYMCSYDTDIYRVMTLKNKNPILLMLYIYVDPCTISMVCNVVTRLYYLTHCFRMQYC